MDYTSTTNGLPLVPFSDVVKQRELFMSGQVHDYIAQEGGQVNSLRADADIVISGGNRGGGKANSYLTDVITPDGPVKMGLLKVGDKICTPFDGIQTVEQIFEHEKQTCYTFHFDDGSTSTVLPDHRFMVRFGAGNPFKVTTASEVMARYRLGMEAPNSLRRTDKNGNLILPRALAEFPMTGEVDFKEEITPDKLPLHPYILGVITSRGQLAMTSGGATIAHYSPGARDRVFRLGFVWKYTREGKNLLFGYTREQKEILSRHKPSGCVPRWRIPQNYMLASKESRWEYVRGVFDVGANFYKNKPTIVCSNVNYLKDLSWILRSLGIKCKITQNESNDYFRLIVQAPDDRMLFYSGDRQNRVMWNAPSPTSSLDPNCFTKFVTHITKSSTKQKCRCIQVSGRDHLYLTDAFTVNHNTVMLLMSPMYNVNNPYFDGVVLRKEKDDLANIIRESANIYGEKGVYNRSAQLMQWNFYSGAQMKFTYYSGTYDDFCDRFQGRQYAYIGVDEITQMEWEKFKYLITTNRNGAHIRNKFLGTCNPDPESWVRTFIDWWIGEDGYPIPERNGVVRYCFMGGDSPEEITWGNTRREVYLKIKSKIDDLVSENDPDTPENMYVKSVVFVRAELDDNVALLTSSPEYKSNLAQQSDEQRERDFKGNWNFKSVGDDLVKALHMEKCFKNPAMLGDNVRRMSIDVAFEGGDACVMWLWVGWHVADVYVCRLDSKTLLNVINAKREEWRVLEENTVYDLQGVGQYLKGFLPKAMPFNNQEAVDPKYKGMYDTKKSQCAFMLADKIIQAEISFEPSILTRRFSGKNYKKMELREILLQERKMLRADESKSDKGKCLIKKDQVKAKSILGRSPDFMEALLMRMIFELKRKTTSIPSFLKNSRGLKVRKFK